MPASIALARRENALSLFQAYAAKALAFGTPPKGLEQAFAAQLQISPSMWSQIKASRPIGDKLARQIETRCGKPEGWLDRPNTTAALAPAERAFLELALAAWRESDPEGRRRLTEQIRNSGRLPRTANAAGKNDNRNGDTP